MFEKRSHFLSFGMLLLLLQVSFKEINLILYPANIWRILCSSWWDGILENEVVKAELQKCQHVDMIEKSKNQINNCFCIVNNMKYIADDKNFSSESPVQIDEELIISTQHTLEDRDGIRIVSPGNKNSVSR